MDSSILLLFTTTKKRQYHQDLLNACCYPHGSVIAFAYRGKWIPDHLRSKEALINKDGLIVFCEEGSSQYTYHPLRWVRVIGCEPDEDGFVLQLELQNFESYSFSIEDIGKRSSDFQAYVSSSPDYPGNTAGGKRFLRSETRWQRSSTSPSADSAAKYFSKIRAFGSDCFIFIKNPPDGLVLARTVDIKWPEWVVPSGSTFDIELLTISGTRDEELQPDVRVSADFGLVLGSLSHQATSGVRSIHPIRVKHSNLVETGMLNISGPNKDGSFSPHFGAKLRTRPPRLIPIIGVALIGIGPFLATLSTPGIHSPEWKDLFRVASPIFTWVGVWLGLKRIKI